MVQDDVIIIVGLTVIGIGLLFTFILIGTWNHAFADATSNLTAPDVAIVSNNSQMNIIWVDENGTLIPCVFFNYGSYGDAALDCDWEYGRRVAE